MNLIGSLRHCDVSDDHRQRHRYIDRPVSTPHLGAPRSDSNMPPELARCSTTVFKTQHSPSAILHCSSVTEELQGKVSLRQVTLNTC